MEIEKLINRINELYHKSQDVGLTPEELEEQKELRQAYVANIILNLSWTVSILRKKTAASLILEKNMMLH